MHGVKPDLQPKLNNADYHRLSSRVHTKKIEKVRQVQQRVPHCIDVF